VYSNETVCPEETVSLTSDLEDSAPTGEARKAQQSTQEEQIPRRNAHRVIARILHYSLIEAVAAGKDRGMEHRNVDRSSDQK